MANPYAVTPEKIIECLQRLAEEFASEGRRGDQRAALLRAAATIVARSSTEPARDSAVVADLPDR